jgi:uncharacterized membrane protein YqaE (UPF0057 family)
MLSKMKFNREQNFIIILVTIFSFVVWYLAKDYYYVETFKNNKKNNQEERIDNGEWTFFDKVIYGGLGYGNICLPTHLFRVLATILFPPLGIIIKHINFIDMFPWVDITQIILNIADLIKSLLLTSFFYIPGLIYSLNQLKCNPNGGCAA